MRRFILVAASAIASSVIIGPSVELSLLLRPEELTPEWWFLGGGAGFAILLTLIIIAGFGAWRLSSNIDADRDELIQQLTSVGAAIAVFTLIWLLWEIIGTASTFMMFVGVTLLVYGILHTIWSYFQYRSQVTRADVAVRRTQGKISRDIRNWSAAAFGFLLLSLSIFAGIWSGFTAALPEVGEILLPFSGEIAYLGSIVTGYLALAGSGPLGILSPGQWALLALGIGAIALMIRR